MWATTDAPANRIATDAATKTQAKLAMGLLFDINEVFFCICSLEILFIFLMSVNELLYDFISVDYYEENLIREDLRIPNKTLIMLEIKS